MKGLSTEEVGLLTEMKDRCLNKGLYIDENAEKKFKMLCHLEDFSIQYYELQNNWNELKDIVNNTFYKLNGILDRDLLEKQMYIDYGYIRNKMQELEGNNE